MRKLVVFAALGALLVAAACQTDTDEVTDPPEADPTPDVEETEPVVSTAPVNWHAQSENEGEVEGATGTLERTPDGFSLTVETTNLNPGHATTLWVVVVNNPQACADYPEPCTAADLFENPDTEAEVAFGDGLVVDETGEATFSAEVGLGPMEGGWLDGDGLVDPLGAEIHATLNDHGPELEEFMPDMIESYRGGCTDESLPEIFPETAFADGEPGPNTCRLWQSVIFLP